MFDFTLPDWSPSKEELKKDEILGKYLASQRNIRISLDTTYIDVPFIDEVYIQNNFIFLDNLF